MSQKDKTELYRMMCLAMPWVAVAFSSIFIGSSAILLAIVALASNFIVALCIYG